ncbi:hypothetical protein KBA63_04035 [Candidatus Woesebacteria bacterium]|jgi:uncharacterized protein YebE (UPF0316 family)|nr:hypothetical protein [Candidatus Woesebacteria bacterium]MBP9687680.1 hypothetical protein [Candidatus Woesebacteria bacterium]
MDFLLKTTSYLFVGFIEMFLITQRTAFIAKRNNKAAAAVVFLENFIAFFIIWQLAKDVSSNIPGFIAYTIGSCSGTVIDIENLTIDKMKKRAKRIKGFMKFPIRQIEIKPQTTD